MVAGLRLPYFDAVVDLCAGRRRGAGDRAAHGQLAGYSHGDGQSGEQLKDGLTRRHRHKKSPSSIGV